MRFDCSANEEYWRKYPTAAPALVATSRDCSVINLMYQKWSCVAWLLSSTNKMYRNKFVAIMPLSGTFKPTDKWCTICRCDRSYAQFWINTSVAVVIGGACHIYIFRYSGICLRWYISTISKPSNDVLIPVDRSEAVTQLKLPFTAFHGDYQTELTDHIPSLPSYLPHQYMSLAGLVCSNYLYHTKDI